MNTREKAEKLFKSVKKFILCGISEDGFPTAKAVLPAKHRGDLNHIYFTTNTSSNFAQRIAVESKSSVYFFDPILFKGCLLQGEMTISNDMELKRSLWSEKYKDAYPEHSYTDPDFCVLEFKPIRGRYYHMYKIENFDFE